MLKYYNLLISRIKITQLGSLQILQVLRFGTLFLSSVAIAKWLGNPTQIGEYENLVLIGSSFTFFWVSGIINTFIPYIHRYKNASDKRKFISSVFLLLSGLSCFFLLIAFFFKPFLFPGHEANFLYYLIFAFASAPAFFTEYIYLSLKKSKSIIFYAVVSSFLQLMLFTLPLVLHLDFSYSLLGLAVFGILKFLFTGALVFNVSASFTFRFSFMKPFLKACWPVIMSLLVGGSMLYADSYIVRYFFSTAEFAFFQYGARELPFVLLMANALSNVGSGEISMQHSKGTLLYGLEYIKSKSRKIMHLLFPLSMILLLISDFLFRWVYNPSFIISAGIFDIYLLLIVSRLIFPQTVLLALQKNKVLLWAVALEWLVKIALNFMLMPVFGLAGIAYATVAAYLVEKTVHIYALQKQKISIKTFIPLKTWTTYTLILIVVYLLKSFLQ